MRTRVIVHKALLAERSPPRLSLWRVVLPDDAGWGLVPHRAANDDSPSPFRVVARYRNQGSRGLRANTKLRSYTRRKRSGEVI